MTWQYYYISISAWYYFYTLSSLKNSPYFWYHNFCGWGVWPYINWFFLWVSQDCNQSVSQDWDFIWCCRELHLSSLELLGYQLLAVVILRLSVSLLSAGSCLHPSRRSSTIPCHMRLPNIVDYFLRASKGRASKEIITTVLCNIIVYT